MRAQRGRSLFEKLDRVGMDKTVGSFGRENHGRCAGGKIELAKRVKSVWIIGIFALIESQLQRSLTGAIERA
jgi:hypothetical protein